MTHIAKAARALRSRTPARLFSYDTILKRLAQDLEDMPPALRPCIQEEQAVVRPRHLARRGEVPAAEQPHIQDRLRRGATRTHRDDGGASAGATGDAGDTCGLERFREGHCWQDGHEAMPRMERLIKESEEPGGVSYAIAGALPV
jgi:hypothetical protein